MTKLHREAADKIATAIEPITLDDEPRIVQRVIHRMMEDGGMDIEDAGNIAARVRFAMSAARVRFAMSAANRIMDVLDSRPDATSNVSQHSDYAKPSETASAAAKAAKN